MAKIVIAFALMWALAAAPQRLSAGSPSGSAPTPEEEKAADVVAKLVEDIRQRNHMPALQRIDDPHLREDACTRVRRGDKPQVFLGEALSPSKAGQIAFLSYLTPDPSQPPKELQDWVTRRHGVHRYAVGVCLIRSPEHPQGLLWIDVGYYASAIKSFFYRPLWD